MVATRFLGILTGARREPYAGLFSPIQEDPILIAIARLIFVASVATLVGTGPAAAWWRYAEWGMTDGQIIAASQGQAVPCSASAPVCAPTASGATPELHIPSVNVIGLAASTAFVFDANRQLSETVVLFTGADPELVSNALQGSLGTAAEDQPSAAGTKVWRDERHGTIISATTIGNATTLSYRPKNR